MSPALEAQSPNCWTAREFFVLFLHSFFHSSNTYLYFFAPLSIHLTISADAARHGRLTPGRAAALSCCLVVPLQGFSLESVAH